MRFVGYSCRHPEPPLRDVFLPLGRLTILLGRNDAGKSSLLRSVERDLSGGHYDTVDRETSREVGGVFFVAVEDTELRELIVGARNIRRHLREERKGFLGRRPPWGLQGWDLDRKEVVEFDEEDEPIEAWRAMLGEHAPTTEGFGALLDELSSSRLIALEPAGSDGGERVWNAMWCLPALEDLSPELRQALGESPLLPFGAARRRAEAKAAGKNPIALARGLYAAVHGNPRHLWAKGAPVVVAPIGQTRSAHLPRGLAVPIGFPALREEVTDALNDLVTAARHGADDARNDWEAPTSAEESARAAPRNWLEDDEEGWRVHPDAVAAAAFISAAANRLVPGFLAERYRIEVELRPVDGWVGEGGRALDLRLSERRDDSRVEEFPVERVADGMRLWVQLALLEACEQAGRVAGALGDMADEWWARAQPAQLAYSSGSDAAEDLDREADVFWDVLKEAIEDLRGLDRREKPWLTGTLAAVLDQPRSEDWTRRGARHQRLFIVDEPERHLHPNLQREAARWLEASAEQRIAGCLVATHGTPFLALASREDSPLYVYIRREDGGTRCEPFDAGELRGLDEIVGALGFDRGELLTTISLFLVVEGIHDAVFFERVFGELRAARIALLPMEGVSNYKAVIDSDALWRYTTAEVALTTDKFDHDRLEKIVSDPDEARALRTSSAPEETKLLAKLIGLAQLNHKTIHLLGHRGDDLIDVLDEEVVKGEFPLYPGHVEAASLWAVEVDSGAKAGRRKAFYEESFGMPMDVATYARLADAHAAAGVRPPALQQIVEEAVALAEAGPTGPYTVTSAPRADPGDP
jgi:hypothetical protein